MWEEKERESQRLSDRVCSSNSGRATRAHKGRGTVTQLPPLVLFPCTEAFQSHPLSVASLRPACHCLFAFSSRLAPYLYAESGSTSCGCNGTPGGRLDLAYRVWLLGVLGPLT